MQTIILVGVLVWGMTAVTFYLGAKIGLGVSKKENLELPSPVKAIQKYKEELDRREEQKIFETNMANIDNYDGSELGQIDFN